MPPVVESTGTIRKLFRIVSPSCEDMTELMSAMRDSKLSLRTRLRMRLHYLYCSYCRHVRDQMEFMHRTVSLLDEPETADPAEALSSSEKDHPKQVLGRGK